MQYNKLNLMSTTLIVLLLNACGGSNSNDSQTNSCETSYEILVKQIDKDADGTIDEIQNYEYNEDALLTRIYDANTSEDVRLFSYNEEGQNIQMLDFYYIGIIFEHNYSYDDNGRLTSVNVLDEHVENNSYIINPQSLAHTITYRYNGNLLLSTTIKSDEEFGFYNDLIEHDYDEEGKLLMDTLYNYSSGEVIDTTHYSYDYNGNLIRVSSNYYKTDYTYDTSGNMIEENYETKYYFVDDIYKQISTYTWGCI